MANTVGHTPSRPPTPPKENAQDAARLPLDQSCLAILSQHVLLDTPNESPTSSSDYIAGSVGKSHKRVSFKDGKDVLDAGPRLLPPSKGQMAAIKSIIKTSPSLHIWERSELDPDQGFTVMLQAATGQLTQASRDLRLDTYKTLLGCLGAHDNVPKKEILGVYLSGFLEFVRRDIVAKQPATANMDTELVTSVLKVLSAMVCTQGLVDAMSDDFSTFIAAKAVAALEHQETPKVIVDHYLQLLARQKFPERVISPDRVNRILSSINGLEDRLKGNRVIGLMVMIYQRLLIQARNLMIGRAGQWLEFLVVCLSSSIKEIRIRAIAFGTDAALTLGETPTVAQSCLDLLNREHPSGAKVVDSLGSRMLELLKDQDGAIHVPQIWSVIVLFLRGRQHQIERWEHLTHWLGIMQHSFNSSDAKVKRQANIAWNRLVSAIGLDTSTDPSMIKLLRQPIAGQLERKSNDKHLKTAKQVARSSYCNLLYFAFRPQPPQEQSDLYWKRLDLYWESFVIPVLTPKASLTKSDLDFACQVLAALLSSQESRSWEQTRAHQASLLLKPEELPCLDPKWVRLRAAKIINLLERLLLHTDCPSRDEFEKSHFFAAWQNFTEALGEAASKDVHKVYMETMAAFAQITSMLNRYWHHKDGTTEAYLRRLEVCSALIDETMTKVGFQPFVERRLLHDTSGIAFEAAETPSSRSIVSHRHLNTPIMYILEFLINNSHGTETSPSYEKAIQALLKIAIHAASSRLKRLKVLSQLASDVLARPEVTILSRVVYWKCIANETEAALSLPKAKIPASDSPQHPGHDYRQCMLLLELGLREFDIELYDSWRSLSDVVVKNIADEVGQAGIVLAFAEPLARALHQGTYSTSGVSLRYGSYLVDQARWPASRKELERARKQLWGPEQPISKEASLDPFDHLYAMIEDLLKSAYSSPQPALLDAVVEFVSSVTSFLRMCPLSMKAVCLKRLQRGLTVWIKDPEGNSQAHDTLHSTMKDLWKAVLDALESVAKPDSKFLSMLQDLFTAGFGSRHRRVVNSMITMWDHTFATAVSLQYPVELQAVFTKLRRTVDLELPGFIEDGEPEYPSSPLNFVDTQEDNSEGQIESAAAKTSRLLIAPALTGRAHVGKTASHSPGTPSARAPHRKNRTTPKARFRHNDSQVEFAAIESSPLNPESAETQHLTDHQKEIRERQENDAPMFKDIRSSSKTPRSAERPLKLELHKKMDSGKPLDVDAEPSPTFPPGDATMNEFLGSSPTPLSSSRSPIDHTFEDSPGLSHSNPIRPMSARSLTDSKTVLETADVPESTLLASDIATPPTQASPTTSLSPSKKSNTIGNQSRSRGFRPDHRTVSDQEQSQRSEQSRPETVDFPEPEYVDIIKAPADLDMPMVVDPPTHDDLEHQSGTRVDLELTNATQEPTTPVSMVKTRAKAMDKEHTSVSEVKTIEKPLCRAEPSTPTEDDLAREQLLRDLEEASSQASSQVPRRRPSLSSPSEASKKRKDLSKDSAKPNKKARLELPSSSQTVEVVVETRRDDLNSDEYIVIDDEPAVDPGKPSSPFVKQELLPSPVKNFPPSSSQASQLDEAHVCRRTRSMAGSSSAQSSQAVEGSPQLGTDGSHAELGPVKRHLGKRRRSASTHNQDAAEPNKRSKQGILPQKTPVATQVQQGEIEEEDISSSREGIKGALLGIDDARLETQGISSHSTIEDLVSNTPLDAALEPQQPSSAPAATAGRSSGQRLLDRFKTLLHDLRNVTLWPAEEKAMMKVALEVVGGVHEAGFRNGRGGSGEQ
ncbi:MAG: hypothetical protein Q9168_001268 [Polycauliona sp. 1 TL-2023]